jgi:ribosomal protein S18 acetylase RimI-like enzyme
MPSTPTWPDTIRPFRPDDVPDVVALENADLPPESHLTPERWIADDPHKSGQEVFLRLVAGQPAVGYLNATDRGTTLARKPGVCHLNLVVHPEHRRRGLGTALYQRALAFAAERGCHSLLTWILESEAAVAFLRRHGFEELQRRQTAHLDLDRFDPAAFAPLVQRVERQGVRLLWSADLPDAPATRRRLFDLLVATDTLSPGASFEAWSATLDGTDPAQEGFLLAEADGAWIAYTQVGPRDRARGVARTLHAATLPAFRDRGIGTAVKLRSLELLRAMGYRHVTTSNRVENAAMLAINRKLGYVPDRAELTYAKPLREPESRAWMAAEAAP